MREPWERVQNRIFCDANFFLDASGGGGGVESINREETRATNMRFQRHSRDLPVRLQSSTRFTSTNSDSVTNL